MSVCVTVSMSASECLYMCMHVSVCVCVPHLARVARRRVQVQVQVPSDDVQLDSQQNHQHAGAVHADNGASKTWSGSAVGNHSTNVG